MKTAHFKTVLSIFSISLGDRLSSPDEQRLSEDGFQHERKHGRQCKHSGS